MQPNPQSKEHPKESLLSQAITAAFKDGVLAASWRQGLGELGEALKAFPDSIQVRELGTMGAPTPGEISLQRGVYGNHEQEKHVSLVDQAHTAGSQEHGLDQEQKRDHGHGR